MEIMVREIRQPGCSLPGGYGTKQEIDMAKTSGLFGRIRKTGFGREALEEFAREMAESAQELCGVRLALNRVAYLEMVSEYGGGEPADPVTDRIQAALEALLVRVTQAGDPGAETGQELLALRSENTAHMQKLADYAEFFTVYEYVLNRVEHRFSGKRLPDDYSDSAQAEKIISALLGIENRSLQQITTISVLEQLPIRMTRKKYLYYLAAGIDAYRGSDRKAVDQLFFMICSAGMIRQTVEGMGYEELDSSLEALSRMDSKTLTKEEYDRLASGIARGLSLLNRQTSQVLLLQEIINDLASFFLCGRVTGSWDSPDRLELCSYLRDMDKEDGSAAVLSDFSWLEKIEGRQESASGVYEKYASACEELEEGCAAELQKAGMAEVFGDLARIRTLLTQSRFADVPITPGGQEETAGTQTVEAAWLEENKKLLCRELDEKLATLPKAMARAVMAKTLSQLPPFIRRFDELEEYVLNSLSSCSDEAEKLGCLEIIDKLLAGE